jgi:hypothetical protein
VGHIASLGKIKNAFRILSKILKGDLNRWEDNIKMGLNVTGYKGVEFAQMQDY